MGTTVEVYVQRNGSLDVLFIKTFSVCFLFVYVKSPYKSEQIPPPLRIDGDTERFLCPGTLSQDGESIVTQSCDFHV